MRCAQALLLTRSDGLEFWVVMVWVQELRGLVSISAGVDVSAFTSETSSGVHFSRGCTAYFVDFPDRGILVICFPISRLLRCTCTVLSVSPVRRVIRAMDGQHMSWLRGLAMSARQTRTSLLEGHKSIAQARF